MSGVIDPFLIVTMIRRSFRLLLAFAGVVASLPAATAAAQQPTRMDIPGMPDLSGAPADVQAIWKKLMSGSAPTQAEGKRLSDWMEANKDKVIQATKARTNSTKGAIGGLSVSGAGADQPQCPSKTTIPASLSVDPTAVAANALLDSLRRAYTGQLDAASAQSVQALISRVSDPGQLNVIGGMFYLKGYVAPAVLAFIAEVSHASGQQAQRAWGDVGAALIGAKDEMHAVRAMRRALALGGRTAPYVTNLAVAYADLGDLATATTLLGEATRLSPSWAQAWDALARVESCAGNMVAAAHAMDRAQDTDWDASRQDEIDQRDQNSDDAAEASKPLPEPPGPSPFPPPPAGGTPGYFEGQAPKLGGTWQEQATYLAYDAKMSTAFRDVETQIRAERDNNSVTRPPGAGAANGLTLVFAISNGMQAIHAAQRADHLSGARMTMILNGWTTTDSIVLAEGAERANPIQAKLQTCDAATKPEMEKALCFVPWCTAMTSLAEEIFEKRRGAAATLIGGASGLSQTYTKVMNKWFDWAGDPDSRREIDRIRRARLAGMEQLAYIAASTAQAGPPGQCTGVKPEASTRTAKASGDAKRDAGECKSRSIHLPTFATMDADCHEMKMTVDYFDKYGTPTLDVQRASSTKNGKFFIGVGGDLAGGLLGGTIGLQATWDAAGWIQSSGVAATGEAGVDGVAHASGDIMANGRATGPAVSGSASASVPAFGFAPSVNFAGK